MTEKCEACGAGIRRIRVNGKTIPIDTRRISVYLPVTCLSPGDDKWIREPRARVSHLATCKGAAE